MKNPFKIGMKMETRKTKYNYSLYANSHIGRVRKNNQDSYSTIGHNGNEPKAIVIADGMGGYVGGEIASKIAVEAFVKRFRPLTDLFAQSHLSDIINLANEDIHRRIMVTPDLTSMGTTMIVGSVYITGAVDSFRDIMAISSVGDSSAFLVRNRAIEKLTKGHTGPDGHLTMALGYGFCLEPEYVEVEVMPNDVFIFCSDGLTNHLDEKEILHKVNTRSSDARLCCDLIRAANKAGGKDNVTVGCYICL